MLLNNYSSRNELLADWMLESVTENAAVLDVGANDGAFCTQYLQRIAGRVRLLAGVDPDRERLINNPFLAQRFFGRVDEAGIPDESFDCAYSIYVLEHIQTPLTFLRGVFRLLKPGGTFFFLTPNGYQYFVWIARLLSKVGLQERVLRLVQPSDLVEKYHYHAYYRMNTERRLRMLAGEIGFASCEFRYCERWDEFASYFPGLLKGFPTVWQWMVRFIGKEYLLGNLMGRLTKDKD